MVSVVLIINTRTFAVDILTQVTVSNWLGCRFSITNYGDMWLLVCTNHTF